MSTKNKKQIPSQLGKVAEFYLEQLEHAAPVMKNAVDDWQRYCTWCYQTTAELQRNLAGQNESAKTLIDQYQQTLHSLAESALAAQSSWSKASIDGAVELARKLVKGIDTK